MHNATDYRNAPSGKGPLAGQWADKPHRIAYDMARVLSALQIRLDELRDRHNDKGRFGYTEHAGYDDGKETAECNEIEFLENLLHG